MLYPSATAHYFYTKASDASEQAADTVSAYWILQTLQQTDSGIFTTYSNFRNAINDLLPGLSFTAKSGTSANPLTSGQRALLYSLLYNASSAETYTGLLTSSSTQYRYHKHG